MTGSELRERREALSLSQEQLAKKFGCPTEAIEEWAEAMSVTSGAGFPWMLELAVTTPPARSRRLR
jgi:transcriptional regulator with XRE-family HTH domain